jgi:nucleotide-binding universal stress UspA family protein
MYPFRRILIPTDFSTASQWAFEGAARIAAANGAEILVLHIRMTWESDPDELRFPADPSLYEYAEKQEIDRIREQLRTIGVNVPIRMIVKNAPGAGREICRTATEEDVDLIVVSTHARHHVAHLLIGSTTMSIINDPPTPVLAIRYGIKKRAAIKRLVVPVHLKQTSHAALDLALMVARKRGTEVHLLTICSDEERPKAEALLEKLAAAGSGVTITRSVIRGTDVEREIVRYAEKSEADVIFLNAEQQISKTKIDIIRHAATPVMIVPGKH